MNVRTCATFFGKINVCVNIVQCFIKGISLDLDDEMNAIFADKFRINKYLAFLCGFFKCIRIIFNNI